MPENMSPIIAGRVQIVQDFRERDGNPKDIGWIEGHNLFQADPGIQSRDRLPVFHVDEEGMASSFVVNRKNDPFSRLPICGNYAINRFRRYPRLVAEKDESGPGVRGEMPDPPLDGRQHPCAVKRISGDMDGKFRGQRPDLSARSAENHERVVGRGTEDIPDNGFDDRAPAVRKKLLRLAHPSGLAGGEDDGPNHLCLFPQGTDENKFGGDTYRDLFHGLRPDRKPDRGTDAVPLIRRRPFLFQKSLFHQDDFVAASD